MRDESTETPIPGATITVGSLSVTSGQSGQFALANVPTGATQIAVSASGFDPYLRSIVIQAGDNTHNPSLFRLNTLFESGSFSVYLSPDVASFRGVLVVLYGSNHDSRPLIRGDFAAYQSGPPVGNVADYRLRMRALARTHGLALLGAQTLSTDQNSLFYDRMLEALRERPELALAPLLVHGESLSGCMAYDIAVLYPARVMGFITAKCDRHFLDGAPARQVPGYFVIGGSDTFLPGAAANMTNVFLQNRDAGAVWALAIEPGAGHLPVADHLLLFNWMASVVTGRLPETITPGIPVTLRPMDEQSGWLGDRSSFTVAAYACFSGIKTQASWLPSEQTARDWQRMVSSGSVTTVNACGP